MKFENILDAVTAAPEVHTILFENDHIRMLNVKVPAGTRTPMHSHPDNASYIIGGGKLKFTFLDGSSKEVELVSGQVTTPSAGAHIVENIGATEVHVIQIEFKK